MSKKITHPVPPEISAAARYLGRLGGLKGGLARAAKLSPERRKEIAQKAAQARWNKNPFTVLKKIKFPS